MPLKPRLVLPSVPDFVASRIEGLSRQNMDAKVAFVTRLLGLSYFGRNKHGAPASVAELSATYFGSRTLRKPLGGTHKDPATGFPTYQKYLVPFWQFQEHNEDYDKRTGNTKSYRLLPTVEKQLDAIWCDPTIVAEVRDDRNGRLLSRSSFPQNGVCQTSYSRIVVPSIIQLDPSTLNRTIRKLTADAAKASALVRPRLTPVIRYLYFARKCVMAIGGIPNLYTDRKPSTDEPSSGRLWGIGELHPQWMRGAARRALFEGMDLWDYDFRSCHISLLRSLARGYGLSHTTMLDDYLRNKDAIHTRLGTLIGKSSSVLKTLFISFGNGASLGGRSAYELIGLDGVKQLRNDAFVRSFIAELKSVHKTVIDHSPKKRRAFVNAVGMRRSQDGSKGQIIAHIAQGWEAWCLDLLCREFDDVVCLVFDGWISGKQADVTKLEDRIEKESTREFGIPLQMKIKEVAIG